MKSTKSKLKKCGICLILAFLLSGCSEGTQEQFGKAEPAEVAVNEIQEAYAPLVDSKPLEPSEDRDTGIEVTVSGQSASMPDVETVSQEGENYEGVSEVSLKKVTYSGQEMFSLDDSPYLITAPKKENGNSKRAVSNTAKKLNALQKTFPQIPFYTYYVNRATDQPWYAGDGIRVFSYADYFEKELGTDTLIKTGQYHIRDVAHYMNTGYKTDFHVNNRGSYEIYQDIYGMLTEDLKISEMREPVSESDYDNLLFCGLLDAAQQEWQPEQLDVFRTYLFDLGEYDTYVSGKKTIIGMEKEYQQGKIVRDIDFTHQFSYYGGQSGVVEFDFHQPDKPNLLLISDSQGRPSRKLLASHFNRTVFLDDVQYRSMDLEQTVREKEIGVILFMGQGSMFEWYAE